jgi:hypothetical protein
MLFVDVIHEGIHHCYNSIGIRYGNEMGILVESIHHQQDNIPPF